MSVAALGGYLRSDYEAYLFNRRIDLWERLTSLDPIVLPADWAGIDTCDGEWEARLPHDRVGYQDHEVPLYRPTELQLERKAWEAHRRERGFRKRRRWCL